MTVFGTEMNEFWKAALVTSIPMVALNALNVAVRVLVGGTISGWVGLLLWVLVGVLYVVAFVRVISNVGAGDRMRASGIVAGIIIGVISLGATIVPVVLDYV